MGERGEAPQLMEINVVALEVKQNSDGWTREGWGGTCAVGVRSRAVIKGGQQENRLGFGCRRTQFDYTVNVKAELRRHRRQSQAAC